MRTLDDLGLSDTEILCKLGYLVQVTDRTGNILYTNEHWLNVLEYQQEQVSDVNLFRDILSDAACEAFLSVVTDSGGSAPDDNEFILIAKSGKEIHVRGRTTRIEQSHLESPLVSVFQVVTPQQMMMHELASMYDMSVDMMGATDFDGRFVRLNPAWERVLGYVPDELLGTHYSTLIHPDDKKDALHEARRTLNADSIQHYVLRAVCKDETIKWLSWHYIPNPDTQRIYFVVRDITQQRHHQDRLREAKEQLQAIIDNSGIVVALKDLDGRYILVNEECIARFGAGIGENVLGKTDFELFSHNTAHALRKNDLEVMMTNTSIQFEETIESQGKESIYLTTKFMLDDGANPYAVCLVAKDITDRKQTEIQLLLRNRAIENSPSAISIADAAQPGMPLIYVNPAFQRITGYASDEVIGLNSRFLQGDDHHQPEIQQIRDAIAQEVATDVILRNYRKDGTMFYNELHLAPIHDGGGRLTHYVGISMDVTQRVQINARIQEQNRKLLEMNRSLAAARQQAEDAARLKSQFLATMSHELRTPLNAIIGYTEIQLAGMSGDLSAEQRDYQDRVLVNATHLLEMINDVLDISKIEAGRVELVRSPCHLQRWADEIVAQIQGLARDKDLEFKLALDARMPESILCDPAHLRQIAINLLSNAIKFTNQGSVQCDIRKHGRDAWKLIVIDTGIGIPSHLQETIFEEFRQVDSGSQRKTGGSGLGLAIVRRLVLLMGGNIRLKSVMGQGSTFTVILPLEPYSE